MLKKLLLISIFLCLSSVGYAADIRIWEGQETSDKKTPYIVIEGEIVAGDYDRFIKIVRELGGSAQTVLLRTPGGDFLEAMKIGRAMRALKLGSSVPSILLENGSPSCSDKNEEFRGYGEHLNNTNNCTCLSSCFFIHIGAIARYGNYIGVHRPIFEKEKFAGLSEKEAADKYTKLQIETRVYMQEMGVPEDIQATLMDTPSGAIYMLPLEKILKHFSGYLPAHHEWLGAKCGDELTEEEMTKMFSFEEQVKNKTIDRKNMDEYKLIIVRATNMTSCKFKAEKEMREKSFSEFFG